MIFLTSPFESDTVPVNVAAPLLDIVSLPVPLVITLISWLVVVPKVSLDASALIVPLDPEFLDTVTLALPA